LIDLRLLLIDILLCSRFFESQALAPCQVFVGCDKQCDILHPLGPRLVKRGFE
jgi:hypothetical protein